MAVEGKSTCLAGGRCRCWRIYAFIAALWLLVTDRTTLGLFFTDHRSDAPILSAANLLYLPQLWFNHYSSSAGVGLVVAVLAVWGAIRQWAWLAVRVAAWSILIALVILTISTTNEPRHFLPVAPAIWMLAGLGLVDLWRRLQRPILGQRCHRRHNAPTSGVDHCQRSAAC